MLGTFGISAFKNDSVISNHIQYLDYMYGDTKGFVARVHIKDDVYKQKLYTSDWLTNRNRYYDVYDVYTSMNSFFRPERKVSELKRLNALYLDLDCYKIGMTQQQALFELEQDYFGRLLPHPTFVINSGRGLYLIWKIDEDRNALPRWTSVQHHFFEVCKAFNADGQALDAARILRVPFSKNSKSDTVVSIMSFFDVKYTLHEIIKEYDINPYVSVPKSNTLKHPYGEATERQRRCALIIAEKHGLPLPDFSRYEETFNFISTYYECPHREVEGSVILFNAALNNKPLLNGRCQDLIRLFSLRHGNMCRRREIACFLYRLWLCESTDDYEYALQETLIFNASLDCPLPEDYVIKKTASAEKKVKNGETYKYGKRKLIEVLDINEDELQYMKYIYISPETDRERISAKNRRAYLNKLEAEGKLTKKEAVLQRRIDIKTMLDAGHDEHDVESHICEQYDIGTKTFNRDIAIIAKGITGRIIEVVEETIEAVSEAANTASNTIISALSDAQTKIQPPNYRSTACCAAFLALPKGNQRGTLVYGSSAYVLGFMNSS